jgi:hypothetical protein
MKPLVLAIALALAAAAVPAEAATWCRSIRSGGSTSLSYYWKCDDRRMTLSCRRTYNIGSNTFLDRCTGR